MGRQAGRPGQRRTAADAPTSSTTTVQSTQGTRPDLHTNSHWLAFVVLRFVLRVLFRTIPRSLFAVLICSGLGPASARSLRPETPPTSRIIFAPCVACTAKTGAGTPSAKR